MSTLDKLQEALDNKTLNTDKLSNEQILNSEFFALYDVDDDRFDKSQAKKLLQIISNAKFYKSYESSIK